jgi:hypothetical protein
LAAIALATICALGVTAWASHKPSQSLDAAQRLQTANPNLFQSVKISGLNTDVSHGTYLVIVIDTGCTHCQENVPAFNQLFDKKSPPLVAICPNSAAELTEFQSKFKPQFPIGHISDEDFRRLLVSGDTPRTLLLRDANVLKVWDVKAPTETEVKSALPGLN